MARKRDRMELKKNIMARFGNTVDVRDSELISWWWRWGGKGSKKRLSSRGWVGYTCPSNPST